MRDINVIDGPLEIPSLLSVDAVCAWLIFLSPKLKCFSFRLTRGNRDGRRFGYMASPSRATAPHNFA